MKILFILVFLLAIPVIIGLPWCCLMMQDNLQRTFASLPMGYFFMFAVFQLMTFPFTWLHLSFSSLCTVYICILCACVTVSFVWLIKKRCFRFPKIRIEGWNNAYLLIFVALLCYQVYNALTLDRTYMSYDDATYVALANDTLAQNTLYLIRPFTGMGSVLNYPRALQSSIIYPAFFSFVSGISVVTMEHTILDIYYLLLAYIVYAYLGSVLFKKKDILVFLIITSVLYIYGNYSMYSPTMRLLGLNYVGKAILAVVFFPFMFALMIQGLRLKYCKAFSFVLFLLSAAASGLSLFGTFTMVFNVSIPVLLSLVTKPRRWGQLKYIASTSVLPIVYVGLYFIYKLNLI